MKQFLHINKIIIIILSIIYSYIFFQQFSITISPEYLFGTLLLSLLQIGLSIALIILFTELYTISHYIISKFIYGGIIISITMIMIIDFLGVILFNMRLSLKDFFIMFNNYNGNAMISYDMIIIIILTLGLIFLLCYLFMDRNQHKTLSLTIIIGLLISIGGSVMSNLYLKSIAGPYLGDIIINPLVYNLNLAINNFINNNTIKNQNQYKKINNITSPLSIKDLETQEFSYKDYFTLSTGDNIKKNIIVIFAESFEPKYSSLSDGVYDYLPNYDMISQQGIRFTNFLAPGCVSDQSHISFLQGLYPLPYGGKQPRTEYQSFSSYTTSLPKILQQEGYDTTFISTAPLWFLNQRDYLMKQGFEHIIGEESFTPSQQYVFNAAPDGVLYEQTIPLIRSKLQEDKPFYINLQTISTHTPRSTPYGSSERSAWRYADDMLGKFYSDLQQTSFFDNGILIIFGDHRVPGNISAEEQTKLGSLWPAKTLATIIGSGITPNTTYNALIQPIDLYYSLQQLISSGSIQSWSLYNNVFKNINKRERGLFHCKYQNNSIILMDKGFQNINQSTNQDAKDFVKNFQHYELHHQFESGGYIYTGKQVQKKENDILIFGHAGEAALAPANTMEGFLSAIHHGAQGVEVDLSYTKDKINVVRHGEYPINPRTQKEEEYYRSIGCFGLGSSLSIEERNYGNIWESCDIQNNEKVMTFDEFISLTKDTIPLYMIELKSIDPYLGVEQLYDAIQIVKNHNIEDRTIFISYNEFTKKELVNLTGIHVGRDFFPWQTYPSYSMLKNIDYILTPLEYLTGSHLTTILDYNKPIITYTIQSTGDIAQVQILKNNYHIPIVGLLVDDITLYYNTIAISDNPLSALINYHIQFPFQQKYNYFLLEKIKN